MKNYPKIALSLLVLGLFNLPSSMAAVPEDTTQQVSQERKLGHFDTIVTDAAIDIVINHSNESVVKVVVSETRIFPFVHTTVNDGKLTISLEKNDSYNWGNSGVHTGMQAGENSNKITIQISTPAIKFLQLSGSAKALLSGTWNQQELELNLSGASAIEGQVKLHLLEGKIDASSTLSMKGQADQAKLQMTGSSVFKGEQLHSQDFFISMAGSSIATVQASGAITGSADGNSVLNYKGPLDRKNFPVSSNAVVKQIR
ncbi:Putative auto-transporter adhesin, head GIN domain [Chitinophaga ginsengisegetis]|uniref:Putative auto-transporter adhesin, head GIN domain n=1 Tax=Chitinophaga ginsengisegetis TaxID=393003 RepID=A0A1T5NBT0_9BACT|nr:DUF2807 domain-containing protein [Chitinophaga ginsengisegetis]SKC97608.1 Putative auto-transporter adhesin, head GIN domain [Chitinophaga ginsengisegetis]